jgi:peptidyl-prolyl cis-trans isomerase A (cyclophilin A)
MPMQTMLMRFARVLAPIVAATAIAAVVSSASPVAQSPVRVRVQTELGDIVMEIDAKRARNTAANFLRYLNAGHYDGGTFHRTVKMDNQPDSPVKIEVIQAGVNPDRAKEGFPPILLERTSVTGLRHTDGVISMARGQADSATSGWFICINDQPSLDYGGARNPDGQGFAAFGRVVQGMEVVRKIQQAPNTDAQRLTPPIKILKVTLIR